MKYLIFSFPRSGVVSPEFGEEFRQEIKIYFFQVDIEPTTVMFTVAVNVVPLRQDGIIHYQD